MIHKIKSLYDEGEGSSIHSITDELEISRNRLAGKKVRLNELLAGIVKQVSNCCKSVRRSCRISNTRFPNKGFQAPEIICTR